MTESPGYLPVPYGVYGVTCNCRPDAVAAWFRGESPDAVACGALTGCLVNPFYYDPTWNPAPAPTYQPFPQSPALSDADVERIARRAAELVLEALKDRLPLRVTRSTRPEVTLDPDNEG